MNIYGKMLNRLRYERQVAREQAEADIWKRNGLDNPNQRNGYKLAETQRVNRDGTEITELRLYKLIDSATIVLSAEVSAQIVKDMQVTDGS